MIRHRKQTGAKKLLILCVAAAIGLIGNSAVFGASFSLPKTRVSAAGDKFAGAVQIAAAFEISDSNVFRAHHIELAIGSISASNGDELALSIGPVWRMPMSTSSFFAELSISPTYISGSTFNGRDLGGNFHFTSSVALGRRLGRSGAVLLRAQHMSNGGISSTNPGIDMLGIEFSLGFSE